MTEPNLRAALRAATALGGYFDLDLDPTGPDWYPLSALIADENLLREHVTAARSALAHPAKTDAVEFRVAASIHFLGLVSRLISPALGTAVLGATVPLLDVETVRWRTAEAGRLSIAITGPAATNTAPRTATITGPATATTTSAQLAARLHRDVIDRSVADLVTAYGATFTLSHRVLRGNVASAAVGAAGTLARAQPARAARTRDVVGHLVGTQSLADTGEFRSAGFVRASCCLYYRVPRGGLCGDCVLAHRPHRG